MGFGKGFEHEQALFDAALEEFVSKGYQQASINTILQAAGMSKGQFYYHFGNKEGLYLALIGVLIEKKRVFLAQVMQASDFRQDIFDIFRTQIRQSAAFARVYPVIDRFSRSFIRERGNPIYEKALATYNFMDNDAIAQLIEMAYGRGDFRSDLPLPFIKRLVGYLFTHSADILVLNGTGGFEDELNQMIDFMKSGLAPHNL